MKPLVLFLAVLVITGALIYPANAGKKKRLVDGTQVLDTPPEPPAAVAADTRRLIFRVSPLSSKGLLSQQTRDAIRSILKENDGLQVVKIRAFVAGAGDLRRVPQLVSETFSEKKRLQLPAVTVIQAGGLALAGAQVVLESVAVSKHDVNPQGLIFLSAIEHSIAQPLQPLAPLAHAALGDLAAKLNRRGEVVRVTCFATMLDDAAAINSAMSARFPGAAVDLVQTQRAPARSAVSCEAVARATAASGRDEPGVSFVNSDRVVMTGTLTAYGFREEDTRIAFRRLDKELGAFGASLKTASTLDAYPLSSSIAAQVARLRPEFTNAAHPPAGAMLTWEGLPGMDSSFAIEAVAAATTPHAE